MTLEARRIRVFNVFVSKRGSRRPSHGRVACDGKALYDWLVAQALSTPQQPSSARCASIRALAPIAWIMWAAAALSGFAGCRQRAEQTIKDSEGRSFALRCSHDRQCEVSIASGSGTSPASHEDAARGAQKARFRLETAGRVVGVCGPNASSDARPQISDCRPVVCESAGQCPAAEGLDEGVCINQLCTEPSHPVITSDATMLCLAGTGYGPTTPLQVERLALGLNCGNPCRVPTPCRQP